MPRPHRLVPAGYVYHVLNRGCFRREIFDNSAHYRDFIRLLAVAAARFGVRIIAYCLMPNHWHLLLWPLKDGAISAFVHWLCTSHAARVARDRRTGISHLYQARFRCFVVETTDYYYRAVSYVEGNARRAGLVAKAEHWPWSSAIERVAGSDRRLIVPGPLALPDDWLTVVNTGVSDEALQELRECGGLGRPYGSSGWRLAMASELRLEQTLRRRGRPSLHSDAEREAVA